VLLGPVARDPEPIKAVFVELDRLGREDFLPHGSPEQPPIRLAHRISYTGLPACSGLAKLSKGRLVDFTIKTGSQIYLAWSTGSNQTGAVMAGVCLLAVVRPSESEFIKLS
jgi:hypothetical protein